MVLKYMIDTRLALLAIQKRPAALNQAFDRYAAALGMSTVTLAELTKAAEKSTDPERNLQVVYAFASRLEILDFDIPAASHAGDISARSESASPLDIHDVFVAAHARSKGAVLLTTAPEVYTPIKGLRVQRVNENTAQEQTV